MEIFGLITGHYFSDYGNGLDGSEPCFSVQSESFRVIGLTTVIALFGYLKPLMAVNRVMRDHPDWIKKSGFGAKIPLPMAWHFKRLCVLGASLLVIGVGFVSLYKPQIPQTNLQDQIDIIQMDHDLEREQKFDQVLDTITPDDKKSE